jgi:hypothetical protein
MKSQPGASRRHTEASVRAESPTRKGDEFDPRSLPGSDRSRVRQTAQKNTREKFFLGQTCCHGSSLRERVGLSLNSQAEKDL